MFCCFLLDNNMEYRNGNQLCKERNWNAALRATYKNKHPTFNWSKLKKKKKKKKKLV